MLVCICVGFGPQIYISVNVLHKYTMAMSKCTQSFEELRSISRY
jgi:hypothetical protein